MTFRVFALFGAAWLTLACGPKRIPAGTPPPEYEEPVVTPWPPASAPAEPAGTKNESEPAGEPDAGGVDAGEPSASDAGATQQVF
jgi:hypothetical protein